MTRPLNEDMSFVIINSGQVKLPDVQNTSDKLRLIEHKRANIANMKVLLVAELNESTLSKKRIAEITSVVSQKKSNKVIAKNTDELTEDLDTVLNSLLKSKRVSAKCRRIAQIILDEEIGIDEAKKAIACFEADKARKQKEFDRIRQNNALLANTGKRR